MEDLLTTNKDEIPDFLSLAVAPNEKLWRLWKGLIGIDEIKQQLIAQMKLSLDPINILSWYQRSYGLSKIEFFELPTYRKRVLLLGPSGTGKTTIARGLAEAYSEEIGEEVYLLELGLVRSKFVGQTSKNIHKAFEIAKGLSKEHIVILLLDEFDSLANPRNFDQMHEEIREAVNTLIKEIDRLDSEPVFIIACSNLEGNIDEAVKRRFAGGLILRFTRPNYYERMALLKKWLGLFRINGIDRSTVAKKTKNRTHCDIENVVCTAVRQAVEEGVALSLDHLLQAIKEVKPTGDYQ